MKKLTLTLLFAIAFVLSGFSQTVSLKVENASLRDIFRSLKQQTGYVIIFNEEEVDKTTKLTLSLDKVELRVALDRVLKGLPYNYEIGDQRVIIKPKAQPKPIDMSVQKAEISGTVVDTRGEPIPWVAVSIEGTSSGGATTNEGEFTLTAEKGQTIIFSYLGMETQRIVWTGQRSLHVVMKPEAINVGDVVVTGYQTIDKRKLTSAITSLSDKDLDFRGALTVDQMLEGKVPGLLSMTNSTTPGAASKMRLRGSSTFTGTREPLWVIDGIIYENPVPLSADEINSLDNVNLIGNAITGLNPQDIERIDVLKDASATAIYGTRAANGVIVVTTRTGKVGKTALNYSFNASVTQRPTYNDFDLMNSKDRVDISREIMDKGLYFPYAPKRMGYEGLMMDYWDKKLSFGEFQAGVSTLETTNADWFKALYRNSFSQSHNLSLSGGNDGTRYYFSVGYNDSKGAEIGADLQRFTARMNISTRLRDNIMLDVRMSGSVQDANYNPGSYSTFDEAYYTNRTIPVYNPDGSLYYVDRQVNTNNTTGEAIYAPFNILNEHANGGNNVINKSLNLTANLNWEIIPNLRYMATGGLTTTTNLSEQWMGEKSFQIADLRGYAFGNKPTGDIAPGTILEGGTYSHGSMNQYAWTIRNQINYNIDIGENHNINIDLGHEAKSTLYSGTQSGTFPGYMNDRGKKFVMFPFTYEELGTNSGFQVVKNWFFGGGVFPTITDKAENSMSLYGTATYTFKNLYSVNFNIRNDGSNRFGQYNNEKFNPVWSVSGRWNISDEQFMEGSPFDVFALRGSYGYRGNVPNMSPYLIISRPEIQPESGESSAIVNSFPNANLKWEKTSTINLGLDWALLQGRISGALNYYYSKSIDLITSRPVSLVNGMTSLMINDGQATNNGVEFNITTRNIDTKNFKWGTSLSYSYNKNTIKRGSQGSITGNTYTSYVNGSVIREGASVDGFYSYKFAGLDEYGLPRFNGIYGNGQMTSEQYLDAAFDYSGSRTPMSFGSFSTEFSYKKLFIRAEFSYKLGYSVRLLSLYKDGNALPFPETNMNNLMTDRWRKPGDVTNIPVLTNIKLDKAQSGGYTNTLVDFNEVGPNSNTGWYMYDNSDIRVAKGDHIRLRTVSVGYGLDFKWMKKIGVSNARVDLQMQNLGVLTFDKKLKGQDPDQVESIGMPVLPTYNFNLSFSF